MNFKKLALAALSVMLIAAPAVAADFTVTNNKLLINGAIADEDYFKFITELDKNDKAFDEIMINSPGGAFLDGLLIGMDVSAIGIPVTVVGECHSSCAWIWLASPKKSVFKLNKDGTALVSIHMPGVGGISQDDDAQPDELPDWLNAKIDFYLKSVGLPEMAAEEIKQVKYATKNWKKGDKLPGLMAIGPKKMAEWGLEVEIRY